MPRIEPYLDDFDKWMISHDKVILAVMRCRYDGVSITENKVVYGLSWWPSHSELLFEHWEFRNAAE